MFILVSITHNITDLSMYSTFILVLGIFAIFVLVPNKNYIPKMPRWLTLLIVVLAIMGIYFAPFGFDRREYAKMFLTPGWWNTKDLGWETYNSMMRIFLGGNVDMFFLVNDILYTGFFVYFGYRMFRSEYRFYFLALLFVSLGYYAGGANIMRAGMATALIYLAISHYRNKVWFIALSLCACTLHLSISILAISLAIGYYMPKLRWFFVLWCVAVCLSYMNFDLNIDMFSDMSNLEVTQRLNYYKAGKDVPSDLYTKQGWRWDFLLYSFLPMIFIWYYKTKCRYRDRLYDAVAAAYILTNILWVFNIRIPFADRIALLSWVLIPILAAYPPLRAPEIPRKNIALALSFVMPTLLNLYVWLR